MVMGMKQSMWSLTAAEEVELENALLAEEKGDRLEDDGEWIEDAALVEI